jgi:antitoxin component YwqK of YwqJK toxin-antitoxin module
MKKITVLLILTLLTVSCFAGMTAVQTENSKVFYDGVTKVAQWTYVNGNRSSMQGVTITGDVKITTNIDGNDRFAVFKYLRNGIVDGAYTWYFSVSGNAGNASAIENYAAGRINGPFKAYFKDGKLSKEGAYNAGRKDGEWKTYYNNGEIAETVTYKNDSKEGDYIKNYESGANNVACKYVNNKIEGDYIELYDTGTMKLAGTYKAGLREGNFTMYYESGEKQYAMRYKTGKVLGAINDAGKEFEPVAVEK